MGEEAYDEVFIESAEPHVAGQLVIRGGYSRDEVYVGICHGYDSEPAMLIAVDGAELKRALRSMVIGEQKTRRKRALAEKDGT